VNAAPAAADASARRLLRRHYENFWVSSFLVPRSLQPHLARIYAFCRITDDLGDEGDGDATAALQVWREDLLRCYAQPPLPHDPALRRLADTIAAFALGRELFLDLIEANLLDQRISRYENYEQLVGYCRLSAAPVGRMVLRLYRLREAQLDRWSDDVCIGLQLANFAQDVSLDQQKGRIYLVQSELDQLGVEGAVRSMCERAAALLRSGLELEAAVPYRLRVQLSLYRRGGEAILAAVKRIGYRTDRQRPRVSNLKKTGLLLAGMAGSLGRRADAHQYRPA
jgi:squalene synthase HpnC